MGWCALVVMVGMLLSACQEAHSLSFIEAGEGHFPEEFDVQTKDVVVGDFDGDGDQDVAIAHEYGPNWLLLNDGSGRFHSVLGTLFQIARDSEDAAVADFDSDGSLDIFFANEDDRIDELYLNDGTARFSAPVTPFEGSGRSNAALASDVNGDGHVDLLLGNAEGLAIWIGDGAGGFRDESAARVDRQSSAIQDLELGDANGDGIADLVVASDGNNALYFADGAGNFSYVDGAIALRDTSEQTREADFADIDSDGDLDLYFANVAFGGPGDARDRLLINDGTGHFREPDRSLLPPDDGTIMTMDADFHDIDRDGDLDIVATGLVLSEGLAPAPLRVVLNNGRGSFEEGFDRFFRMQVLIVGTDIEFADFDGDGLADLYVGNRAGRDRLFFARWEEDHVQK